METVTELLTALFIFSLGLIFLLERSGWIKQQLSDWKAKRKGHTKMVLAVSTLDDNGEEEKVIGYHMENGASQLLTFFPILTLILYSTTLTINLFI